MAGNTFNPGSNLFQDGHKMLWRYFSKKFYRKPFADSKSGPEALGGEKNVGYTKSRSKFYG